MIPTTGTLFERRFSNQLDSLHRVIEELAQFLEQQKVGGPAINVAQLVIEEMVTNTLKYGYEDTAPHEILLRVQLESGSLLVELEDDGREFNPLVAPPPDLDLPIEKREPGGLGIHLVRKLAADVAWQRRDGRNHLTVKIAS